MSNFRTLAIIKREVKAQVFSKTFIFMTLLMPLIIFGSYTIFFFVATYDANKFVSIEIVSKNNTLLDELKSELETQKDTTYTFSFQELKPIEDINSYIHKKRSFLLDGTFDGIVFISPKTLSEKTVQYYSKNPQNKFVLRKIRSLLNSILIRGYLKDNTLTKEQISYIKKRVAIAPVSVSEDATKADNSKGKMILAGFFSFLLYLSVILIGTSAMRSTIEEKINRVVEILLSSVNSRELIQGKIIASSIAGLAQMFIWTLPAVLIMFTSFFSFQGELDLSITISQFSYFFINYITGLVSYVSLFAAVGAIFDNDQDAQQGVAPLTLFIMIPFYIAISLFSNPENPIGEITSMLPLFSVIVMPARMILVDVPTWQILIQLSVNVLTLYACSALAGKIYRIGILMTGKKPKWSEVLQWLKA